ncbi:hypothetical protein MSTO_15900 [Mycobacterium stomatepiae]|uniref:Uncharacterized protein n=1 Tax=Mycobacterium stomatepiae TaxID=470076 RepID=A0A7I7Q4W9_9MYCO|nr:hypothetical protein MSTO_15900 [Mycobacterium stomatepiae]
MTFKMVRCRWVSDESTECSGPLEPVAEVSLLSLMALNVASPNPRIKHVFDWRVVTMHMEAKDPRTAESHVCNFYVDRVFAAA